MNTKKITSTIVASACAFLLVSCDMDKYPYNGIPTEDALTSLSDCQSLRSGMYRDLRILSYSQDNFLATEMQADCIIPTDKYGQQFETQYRWLIEPADGSVTTVWSNNYVAIAQCNLLIGGIPRLEEEGALADEDIAEAHNILGEAYMVRAMCYFDLATKYCKLYDSSTADSEMGVPLVREYTPAGDNSAYPGRSSLADTYTLILEDIANAKSNLTAEGQQESIYLTVDALTAFEARVALLMGNNNTAVTNAMALINSKRYPLISNNTAFSNMWLYDTGSELICQLYADLQEGNASMGSWFLDEITNNQTMLPAQDIIDMYAATDIRRDTYFDQVPVAFAMAGLSTAYCINKYPGNPALYQGSNNYANKVKIFRIAEMYLVAAEAYYNLGGTDNERNAYNVLYQLMFARDATVQNQPVGGTVLRNLIRDERLKELCYEGFRWLDLKRYGEGFTRMSSQGDDRSYQFGLNLQISADDHQWVWPIPRDEIESNPQIKSQQNPGY